MKKLLLLMTALLTLGAGGAWADVTVTISDQTDLDGFTTKTLSEAATVHKYGTYANGSGGQTFTTNGDYAVVISSTANIIKPTFYDGVNYKHCFAITPPAGFGTSYTVTLTAPDGYYIKSYSMTAISTSSNGQFTVTPLGAASGTNVTSSQVTISATPCANTASFTVVRNNTGNQTGTELCLPFFTVTLAPTTMSGDVELAVNSTTGTATRDDGSAPSNNADFRTYTSTSTPAGVTLQTGSGNNMNWTATAMRLHSNGGTYTLTAPSGYYIKGYKMTAYAESNNITNTIKPAEATTTTLLSGSSSDPTIICVDGINAQSTTFTRAFQSGGSKEYANTVMTVYLVPTYTVTYDIYMGATKVATFDETVIKGTTVSELPSLFKRAYCSYSLSSQTITANTTIDVTCTFSGAPFEFASSVEDATTNNKWKEFKRSNNTNYVYYYNGTLAYTATDLSTANGYQWALIGNPYGYKIYNRGAEGYLTASIPTSNNATTTDFAFNSTGVEFELFKYKQRAADDHFVSVVKGTNTNVNTGTVLNESGGTWKMWCGKDNSGFECNNGLMNGLSASLLLPFDVPTTFVVTYNVNDGSGNQVATDNIEVEAGDRGDDAANHLPSSLNKTGCVYTYSPTTVSETNNVITVTYTYNTGVGVDVYEDYASISKWYFLKRNNEDYIVYDSGITPNVKRSTDLPDGDNASWAFVGNPFQGFKLYNKGATSSVWAVSDTPSTADTGASATVSMASTGDVQKWFISTSDYFTNGFFLGNSDGYKLNGRQNQTTICYWTGGADGGSTFVAIENTDYAANVVSELGSYFSTNVDNLFALSQATYNAQSSNYTSYSSHATYKQYQELKAAVSAGINYPTNGGYYRIKNVSSNNYIGYGTAGYSGKGDGLIEVNADDASSVVKLTGTGGVYTLSTQGLNAKTQSTRNIPVTATSAAGDDYTFTILTPGVVSIRADLTDAKGYLFRSSWGSAPESIITWEVSGNEAKWSVEAATSLTIHPTQVGDMYYATLCLPFTVTLSGATAYTLHLNGAKDGLTLSAGITTVPAGTPVLLRGDDAEVTASIEYNEDYQAAPLTSTALTGTYVSADVNGNTDYFLGYKDGQIGFYHWTGSTLGANRAYLEASKLSDQVKGFALNFDDVDAVTDVQQSAPSTPEWYDLSGRRINQPTQGLYIKNGKKVLVK